MNVIPLNILVAISRKQTCHLSPYKVEKLQKETREKSLWFGGNISDHRNEVQRLKPQEERWEQQAALS